MDNYELMDILNDEFKKAEQAKQMNETDENDIECRTVRIFISSTFRDFHNERNVLVTRVFPRLREWCSKHMLHLVECDLRWGIPTNATREETLSLCMEEIEKGRNESNDMNFFLGLLGERYGWVPDESDLTDFVKNRYSWIPGSSVTLMEFIHGMIRSLTPNGLILFRNDTFIKDLPEIIQTDFIESDINLINKLNQFKNFLSKNFSHKDLIKTYKVNFKSYIYDELTKQNQVLLNDFDEFEDIIEKHFKYCIKENLITKINNNNLKNENINLYHEFMAINLDKNCIITSDSFNELLNKINYYKNQSIYNNSTNPIILLSGQAGIGKSTILGKCAQLLKQKCNINIFFHSVSCTVSSQFQQSITERLYEFIFPSKISNDDLKSKMTETFNILKNGYELNDKQFYVIMIDGVDEMVNKNIIEWVKFRSNKNFIIIYSCVINNDNNSFYNILRQYKDIVDEIEVKPLTKSQIKCLVNSYLLDFGKVLDNIQMNALLNHNMSHNPLWLISACEELRIYGDYSTLLKFIETLPSNLLELSSKIIQRLLNQDNNGNLKLFLFLLLQSRAGIWESMGTHLISALKSNNANNKLLINCREWNELIRPMKSFLQVQCKPLPLIKFRHKIYYESVNLILKLEPSIIKEYHKILADVYEPLINEGLYMYDYIFHILKSRQAYKLVQFFRSKLSWKILKNYGIRKEFMKSLRCSNLIDNKSKCYRVKICASCSNLRGNFSIFCVNKFACYLCGCYTGCMNLTNDHYVYKCRTHSLGPNNCIVCEKLLLLNNNGDYVRLCSKCKLNQYDTDYCGQLIKDDNLKDNFIDVKLQKLIEIL